MSLNAITGLDHLPKSNTNWLTYKPDFISSWTASTRTDVIDNDGWLSAPNAVDYLFQIDVAKVFNPACKKIWFSFQVKIMAMGASFASQYLILIDTIANPNANPQRAIQFLGTCAILPTPSVGKSYQVDIMFNKELNTYEVLVDSVSVLSGAVVANMIPYIANGNYFVAPFMRRANQTDSTAFKSIAVYDDINTGDSVVDYLGLLEVQKLNIDGASITDTDWTPLNSGDTPLQAITKAIDTASAAGMTTTKHTPLNVSVNITVPNTKRIRGIGFLTSSSTTSGGTALNQDYGGVTGRPIAQKTAMTHGQRSKIFTADSNGLAWTQESVAAADLAITAG